MSEEYKICGRCATKYKGRVTTGKCDICGEENKTCITVDK